MGRGCRARWLSSAVRRPVHGDTSHRTSCSQVVNRVSRCDHQCPEIGSAAANEELTVPNAVIVDAVRTAGGKRNGKLSGWHPADLAAEVLNALAERNGLDPARVDDVIMGCVMQVGA